MSSTVNMDMALISTSNIIPQDQLRRVFEECVKELGGVIQNNNLFLGKENLGKLTINNRIVLSFSSDYETSKRAEVRKLLRDTFTRRVAIAHENYLYELKKEKERLEQQSRVEAELLNSLKDTTDEIGKKIEEVDRRREQKEETDQHPFDRQFFLSAIDGTNHNVSHPFRLPPRSFLSSGQESPVSFFWRPRPASRYRYPIFEKLSRKE